jgi:uncharacterized protein
VTVLLDGNVLIALLNSDHVHHRAARRWLVELPGSFATCPVTEGALARFALGGGRTAEDVEQLLGMLAQHPRREFWPDSLAYDGVPFKGVIGHRQVTDAYLAQLTRSKGGRLATFDKGLAQSHGDVAELIPT